MSKARTSLNTLFNQLSYLRNFKKSEKRMPEMSMLSVQPQDLRLIREIFHESCESFQISKSSADAAALATILIRQLHKGRRERSTLRAIAVNLLTESLDRPSSRPYLDAGQRGF
jgi:hypothetical protein